MDGNYIIGINLNAAIKVNESVKSRVDGGTVNYFV